MDKTALTSNIPKRGSVYQARLEPIEGREIGKTRPVVVVSNDDMNELSKTVIVMPITSGGYAYYLRIPVRPPEGGLNKPSVIATEQLRAIDKSRLEKRLGEVSELTMRGIEKALTLHFDLK